MDTINDKSLSRKDHILAATLKGHHTMLESNMFLYEPPEGIEHWTLWSRDEMDDDEVERYLSNWMTKTAPHVLCWNFAESSSRLINLFHVHVYFQVSTGQSLARQLISAVTAISALDSQVLLK